MELFRRLLKSKLFLGLLIGVAAAGSLLAVGFFRRSLLRAEERDDRRRRDLHAVVNACYLYAIRRDGRFPSAISRQPLDIGTSGLNLAADLFTDPQNPLPVDPLRGDAAYTGYVLFEEADGRLTASATGELTATITITR